MPSISFEQIQALPDVLLDDRFELLINPKGDGAGNTEALTLRCQGAAMPGSQIEQVLVGLSGHQVHFRGRKIYPNTLAITYVETHEGIVMTTLRQWKEYIVGSSSGNGASKQDYSVTATLNIFDEGGNVALSIDIEGLWITDIQDTQLNGSAAQPFLVMVTFSYDRALQDGVSIS